MSDDLKTVKLTAREIDLIHQCISVNIETVKRRHTATGSSADLIQELSELSDDLLEQRFRPADPDLLMGQIVICDAGINAETEMFIAGVKAREDAKLASRAAARRQTLFRKAPDRELSETQKVDVWTPPINDPAKW